MQYEDRMFIDIYLMTPNAVEIDSVAREVNGLRKALKLANDSCNYLVALDGKHYLGAVVSVERAVTDMSFLGNLRGLGYVEDFSPFRA